MISENFVLVGPGKGSMSELFDLVLLWWSIWQGCPLDPYPYVIATNTLGYLLEVVRVQGTIKEISFLSGK